MSNLLDRINLRMSLIEYELDLLRNMIELHSLEESRRNAYSRERYFNREDRNINSLLNSILQRRNNISSNYSDFTNSRNYQNSTNLNSNISRDTNINQTRNPIPASNSTNIYNEPRNRNVFSNLFSNIIPELVEVSIIDSNGRPIRNNTNTSLENLRNNTSIEVVIEDTDTLCTICRTNISEGEVVRKINSCGHMFHINCIDQWFEEHTTCPTCRNSVNHQEETQT